MRVRVRDQRGALRARRVREVKSGETFFLMLPRYHSWRRHRAAVP